jgi:hypothetical protein
MGDGRHDSISVATRIRGGRAATLVYLVMSATLAVLGLAACSGSTASPMVRPSAVPSAYGAATEQPTETASPTPSLAPSPSPAPTFVATGSMKHARMDATATLLLDGRVLIAGGVSDLGERAQALITAELYDPANGKFTSTGSMNASYTNATLLSDGLVLMSGGSTSAELYDPKTGKFSKLGSLPKGFDHSTATRLNDGRVLLISGNSAAELYDPSTSQFVPTGSLAFALADSSPVPALVAGGKVLVIGTSGSAPAAALYDPTTGGFGTISFELKPGTDALAKFYGQTVVRRQPDSATPLSDGRVLLYTSGYLANYGYLETFDVTTAVFTPIGFASPPGAWGQGPSITLLANGDVLFAGGDRYVDPLYSSQASASAGLYDPAIGFQAVSPMPSGRTGQTATLLKDGRVLLAGGITDGEGATSSALLFG